LFFKNRITTEKGGWLFLMPPKHFSLPVDVPSIKKRRPAQQEAAFLIVSSRGTRTHRVSRTSHAPSLCYRNCRSAIHNSSRDDQFFEQLIAFVWNWLRKRSTGAREEPGTYSLGFRVVDGQVTGRRVTLTNAHRTMHTAVLGKTGTGKSSFLRYLSAQDIERGRGFVYFDFHGDASAVPSACDPCP
jgi:Helicase HerA, central domain